MTTSSIILWKEQFSVGVADVDADHRQLIKMINRLFGAALAADPHRVVALVLAELSVYVVDHFHREETYMREQNYPEYARHKASHDRLLASASRLKQQMDSGLALDLKSQIEQVLRDWLVAHIQDHDQQLGTFLNARGIH